MRLRPRSHRHCIREEEAVAGAGARNMYPLLTRSVLIASRKIPTGLLVLYTEVEFVLDVDCFKLG